MHIYLKVSPFKLRGIYFPVNRRHVRCRRLVVLVCCSKMRKGPAPSLGKLKAQNFLPKGSVLRHILIHTRKTPSVGVHACATPQDVVEEILLPRTRHTPPKASAPALSASPPESPAAHARSGISPGSPLPRSCEWRGCLAGLFFFLFIFTGKEGGGKREGKSRAWSSRGGGAPPSLPPPRLAPQTPQRRRLQLAAARGSAVCRSRQVFSG